MKRHGLAATAVLCCALTLSGCGIIRTANAIGDLGGALEDMPKKCITIGIAEILAAKRVRLGVFRDWHRAVVRRAAYGDISSEFPVTLLQNHPDVRIYVNANAARLP